MRDPEKSISERHPRRARNRVATTVLPEVLVGLITSVTGLAIVVGLACSSAVPADETWTASYVDPPDRVWAATIQTLETLGYEIDEADRHESIIVASAAAKETTPALTLRIAQVAHTEVVRVHVSPLDGAANAARYEAAASEFLAALDATMKGVARPEESNDS